MVSEAWVSWGGHCSRFSQAWVPLIFRLLWNFPTHFALHMHRAFNEIRICQGHAEMSLSELAFLTLLLWSNEYILLSIFAHALYVGHLRKGLKCVKSPLCCGVENQCLFVAYLFSSGRHSYSMYCICESCFGHQWNACKQKQQIMVYCNSYVLLCGISFSMFLLVFCCCFICPHCYIVSIVTFLLILFTCAWFGSSFRHTLDMYCFGEKSTMICNSRVCNL